MTSDDMALVREFARNNSNEAFSELVNRHVRLVYSVALRQTGDLHLAEEITQAVFIILARKAHSLGPNTILSAWLCRTARYASANALKIQARRQRYEQKAQQEASMQSAVNETQSETWREIGPLLDDALGALGEKEHTAIVLRFLEGKDFKEVAAALHTGEDAARMRVNRALEKLRKFFGKRGVVSSTEVIAQEISANGLQAAPPALANSVAALAVAKGVATNVSTLALINGTLKTMAWTKVKFACGVAVAILLAGGLAGLSAFFSSKPMQDDRNGRYQIEGSINYGDRFLHDFTLTADGTNWAVDLVYVKGPPGSGQPEIEEVGLNGTIYQYYHFGKNISGAEIMYGDSAVEDGTSADFAWVGLASGYYFSHANSNQVTALFATSGNARNWFVHADWQLDDAPPYLPQSVDYFIGPMHATKVRPNVSIVYTDKVWNAGRLRILQSTNINGRTFPTAYRYEQFRQNLDHPGSSDNVQTQLVVTITVKKIILHDVPEVLPPKTDGTTLINDYRGSPFSYPRGGNMYSFNGDRLPEKPDFKAIRKFREDMMKRLRSQKPPAQ